MTTTNTYDALDDLTAQSATGAEAATADRHFTYSLDGYLVASAVGGTWEYYATNALGDLLTTSGQAGSSSFTYDADENPATRTDASGTSTYTYDTDGRLGTDTDASTGTTLTYQYNSLSQPQSVTFGASGDVRNFGYDSLHRLTSDTLTTASGTKVASVGYDWDKNDNLTSKTTTGVQGASTNAYVYDYANRLTSWTSGSTTTGYTYDADGNRLTAGPTTYTYNARDQLTSDGTLNYSYTARGTLSAKGSTAYTFDAYGQQATTGATTYTYDALGRAITVGSTTLTYSGTDNTVASDGASTYSRDPSGALTGESSATGATLAWTDLHTDVIGQFTASGTTLTASASYDPWGTTTASTLTGSAGYQSEYTDPATGNVNMHARWYSPAAGGFDSADTFDNTAVGDSVNANHFTYANDAPLVGTDPSGHFVNPNEGGGEGGDGEFGESEGESAAEKRAREREEAEEEQEEYATEQEESLEEAKRSNSHAEEREEEARAEGEEGESTSRGRGSSSGSSNGSRSYRGSNTTTQRESAEQAAEERAAAARAAAARRAAVRAHAEKITYSIGRGTLTIRSGTGSVAVAPTVGINISNSVLNAASAIAAGLTTAAVCVSTGGCTGDDDDEGRRSSCDATPLIDGGRIYGGLEEYTDHQGNKGCRATGAIAFLTKSDRRSRTGAGGLPKCSECDPSVDPDGMEEIRAGGGDPQAGHLIGYWGKGTGQDVRNLVALNARANARMASKVEAFGWKSLNKNNSLFMSVVPLYGDTHSAVPSTIQVGMTVYGPGGGIVDSYSCTAINSKTGIGSKC
ncbi:RHS repeat-associated core domain-containing protein [Streptomyces sp. NBC_00986]|uniref:RHS repeat-associated core domain-containing protein n=1 Tax=Streptomyces sp. NBC_00986 TaxID=2903702 RepID=UPI0038648163|nr:DNA/RNA non-specific endonuclease [Streptomyces sp. NBC_00986]